MDPLDQPGAFDWLDEFFEPASGTAATVSEPTDSIGPVIAETASASTSSARFVKLDEADIEAKLAAAIPNNTRRKEQWAVNIFNEWRNERQSAILQGDAKGLLASKPIEEWSRGDWNYLLKRFFFEVRKKDGSCDAENHYCPVPGLHSTVQLDSMRHKSEVFIPKRIDLPQHGAKRFEYSKCQWTVTVQPDNGTEQLLVVEGVAWQDAAKESPGAATILVTDRQQSAMPISAGSFTVIDVGRQPFDISVTWPAHTAAFRSNGSTASVRFSLATPKSCGDNMLSFGGFCYALSTERQDMIDARSSIGGYAQLASFSSMAEISELIAANNIKEKDFPYQRPLKLDQPIRLGMFHCANNSTMLKVESRSNSCELRHISDSAEFPLDNPGGSTGPCVSLWVGQPYKLLLELENCSRPMLSLLTFPTKLGSVLSAAQCNISEVMRLVAQLDSPSAVTIPASVSTLSDNPPVSIVAISVTAACVGAAFICAAAIFFAVRFFRRRRRSCTVAGGEDGQESVPMQKQPQNAG